MPHTSDAFPPPHVYALAHRCSTCGAQPGHPCDAPRKEADLDSRMEQRNRSGRRQAEWDPSQIIHVRRQDVGDRHRARDIAAAPQSEDRVPGRRYDTLGDGWTPGN